MRIARRTYKSYAGIVVYDKEYPVRASDFDTDRHMERAAWLATALEAPSWGTVQSYDGAGMSAGPFHWIGRYSNGAQGPLFGLLRRIELEGDSISPIDTMFRDAGWYIAQDGKLRSHTTGDLISGNAFRNVVAPPHGKVPVKGDDRDRAQQWAVQFHRLLSHRNRQAQVRYAVDYLVRGQGDLELRAYHHPASGLPFPVATPEPIFSSALNEDFDLAMCVYHSHSVNAPAPAAACLRQALNSALVMPDQLIRLLAKRRYGAWEKRYARTRKAAIASGLWSHDLFTGKDAIMPAKF